MWYSVPKDYMTHQLRFHCASLRHSIIVNPLYRVLGKGAPNIGLKDFIINETAPNLAMLSLQCDIDTLVFKEGTHLCLYVTTFYIPYLATNKPMMFEYSPPF